MPIHTGEEKTKLVIAIFLLAILGVAVAILSVSGHLGWLWEKFWEIFANRESLRDYVESWGNYAPVAFIVIQASQVVVAPIPGEFTGAIGGFIFGAFPNIVYSSVGLMLGSMIAFLAARVLGLPLVKLVVSKKLLNTFQFVTERRGMLVALALFALPGFPKDILSYILGLSPMGFMTFLLVCGFGRLPGTIMLSLSGAAVFDENWTLLVILSLLCLAAIGAFFVSRDRIEIWIRTRD